MTYTEKQRVLSYIRRSTKKNEQESSINSQKAHVTSMAENLGIPLSKIEYFIDNGKSGYSGSDYKDSKSETIVRKREGYSGMITEIRKLKVPCKILAWTVSRIARDTKEGGTIYNLLGNNTKGEQRIDSIHFLNGTVWNKHTSQTQIYQQISHEEESSREKSVWKGERMTQALDKGLYPNEIPAPKGLKNLGIGVKAGGIAGGKLQETEDIKYIIRAFKMKAKGESNKQIHSYLTLKGMKISTCNMHTILFTNTSYTGYYIDKKTGIEYKLKYVSGKPPIETDLFNRANGNIGKKKGKYGDNQKNDLLARLLQTTGGRKLSLYTPKGRTAKQYQNATEKVYISQKKVFEEFEDVLKRICHVYYLTLMYGYIEGCEKLGCSNIKIKKEYLDNLTYDEFEKNEGLNHMNFMLMIPYLDGYFQTSDIKTKSDVLYRLELLESIEKVLHSLFGVNNQEELDAFTAVCTYMQAKSNITLKNIILKNGNIDLLESQEETNNDIKELEKEKKQIEIKIKDIKRNGIINGYTKDEVEDATKEFSDKISEIENVINNLENESVSEKDLDRFIIALQNIFEHFSDMQYKGKEEVSEEDMLHLIELTTFELTINPSKGLDIALFEGLKNVFYGIGIPTENGTPISALRRPHPNH